MYILGIDTSCDDTCISLIKTKNFEIISNIVSSQVKIHQKYGGVYPFLAKREHLRNLPVVFKKAVKNIGPSEIDLIGATVGPGLEPCLWTGINFAKDLAEKLNKLIVPINHIEAHILANCLRPIRKNQKLFPSVCLVVSGGHTQLILMSEVGKYKLIGETRDDAAGECFDKTARILGLGYPGGPAIAAAAAKFKIQNSKFKIHLPRPMIHQKNYDFSFSGLKTAVLYDFQSRTEEERRAKKYLQTMAFEIQQAIIDVLIYKTIRAAKDYKVKSIILGGGVAANDELRRQFILHLKSKILNLNFFVPPKKFSTDNAAMIALTAIFHRKKATKNWQKIKADANLKI
jgi:N6-L-threonylcarbamoyladenine synthase